MKRHGWTCQEPGWWTNEAIWSYVIKGADGKWSACGLGVEKLGMATAREAMEWCEQQEAAN